MGAEGGVVPSDTDVESTSILRFILARCCDLLGWDELRPQDNFFEVGGDSLAATELLAACEAEFDVSMDLEVLFSVSTLREFAEAVSNAVHAE
jgi:acyl carrier protein